MYDQIVASTSLAAEKVDFWNTT